MGQRENYYYTTDLLPPADKYFVDRTAVRTVLPQKTDQHQTRSSLSSPLLTNSLSPLLTNYCVSIPSWKEDYLQLRCITKHLAGDY